MSDFIDDLNTVSSRAIQAILDDREPDPYDDLIAAQYIPEYRFVRALFAEDEADEA